jgi:short-subunit dehydrogenase
MVCGARAIDVPVGAAFEQSAAQADRFHRWGAPQRLGQTRVSRLLLAAQRHEEATMDATLREPRSAARPFAIVTGASSGIGYELAHCCAADGYDLLVAADEPEIDERARQFGEYGTEVRALCADLATPEGIDRLLAAVGGRTVDALLANAGHGLGKAFLDQDWVAVRHVVDTNVTGTIALVQRIGRQMRARGSGRILITGSIAGHLPGSYQAVYNGTKAFLDSFSYALREELRDSGVTVTCLMPGATDTGFFERADMLDTKVAQGPKDDAAEVARLGYAAMREGKPGIVTGMRNKLQVAVSGVAPDTTLARMHTMQAAPGSAAADGGGSGKKLVAGAIGGLALLTAAKWLLGSRSGSHTPH